MSVTGLSASRYTLQRTSPFVLDPVTASGGGHSPDRQPATASAIQIKALAAGTVLVSGTVDGSPDTETLSFTGTAYKTTSKRFTAITSFTPAGALLGTTIEAKALGADGTPQVKLKADVATGLPGAFTPGVPQWARTRPTTTDKRKAMLAFDWRPDIEINAGDFLLDEQSGERWLVNGTPNLLRGRIIPHHWEVFVEGWDGEAPA